MHPPSAKTSQAITFPFRVAGVDIGSNAIRLMVSEFSSPGTYRVVDMRRMPVRLGHDVFLSGRLTPAAMDAAASALLAFKQALDEAGVVLFRAVATSALREAANGGDFVERIRQELGWELELIPGAEEARLIHLAIRKRLPLNHGRWITVDVGGGSVEVSLVDGTGILWSESHTMGSVRLLEELAVAGDEPGHFRRLLTDYLATLRLPDSGRPAGFIATGGNIESLVRVAGGCVGEDGIGHIPVAGLRAAIDVLTRLSYRQRMEQLGLKDDRADVILPAALVYEKLAAQAGVEEIMVPFVGVKDGVVLDLVDHHLDPRLSDRRQEEQVASACLTLGRRYRFDEAHAQQVADLALALFDQLVRLHGLGEEDRRILTAAALLHDIGAFVSRKRHHRHSQYLIFHSEIPGLNSKGILHTSLIARFHRKGDPSPAHPDLLSLTPDEQGRVMRLAALLRLADALDREHVQAVRSLRVRLKGRALTLCLDARGDLILERWALTRKSTLLSRLFNVAVTVTVQGEEHPDESDPRPRPGQAHRRRRA